MKYVSAEVVDDAIADVQHGLLALTGTSEQYALIAGVIRNFNDGQGWRLITKPEVANHFAANVLSVTNDAGAIYINFDQLNAIDVVSCVAVPDEVLSRAGFSVGASVVPNQARLYINQQHIIADYVSWNGSAFASANGVFTITSYAAGVLTLTHKAVSITNNGYLCSVTPRDEVVDAVGGSAADVTTQVKFIDRATHTLLTVANANCKAYVNRGPSSSGLQIDGNPSQVHEGTFPGGNIWFMIMLRVK